MSFCVILCHFVSFCVVLVMSSPARREFALDPFAVDPFALDRQPKVDELGVVATIEHDILGFEVTKHDTRLMNET